MLIIIRPHNTITSSHALMTSPLKFNDFIVLSVIGKGSSGQVLLVKHQLTNEIFALKRMSKNRLLKKNKVSQVKLERDVLLNSANCHNNVSESLFKHLTHSHKHTFTY